MAGEKTDERFCPRGAIKGGTVDRSLCAGCEKPCIGIPASGIKLSCVEEDISDILSFIESCKMMFFSGGGVTFTGGEPTMQFDALQELLTELKNRGINTALECNATNPRLPELFPLVDHLICDCKHHNSEKHREVCGTGSETIFRNIALAAEQRQQLLIRIPLIGGFNSSRQDAEAFCSLFKEICTPVCSFEFLRYHEFGKNKYAACGMEYTMGEEAKVPVEAIKMFNDIFKNNSLKTVHT